MSGLVDRDSPARNAQGRTAGVLPGSPLGAGIFTTKLSEGIDQRGRARSPRGPLAHHGDLGMALEDVPMHFRWIVYFAVPAQPVHHEMRLSSISA